VNKNNKGKDGPQFAVYLWALLGIWTFISVSLILWEVSAVRQFAERLAINEARANFNKDQAFRFWATGHGGVYVPITENTPPNPYLSHIPERDIETPNGKKLTLMNPAYMIRQLNERFGEMFGGRGHITSLKPLRPENRPDEWERRALERFEKGDDEVYEFTDIEGEGYLRLMRPMVTQKGCLKCHGHQGYREGDIRGGVSVSVPMKPLFDMEVNAIAARVIPFALLWVLGGSGIIWGWRRLSCNYSEVLRADEEIRRLNEELEGRVEERTVELRVASEELSERNERLERFQKITMGREQRIMELKAEVNGLLERAGEKKRYGEKERMQDS